MSLIDLTIPLPISVPKYKSYSIVDFVNSLTREEALLILATTKTDPLIELWYELAKLRGTIDFNDLTILQNSNYLVSIGIFSQERLNELSGYIPEVPLEPIIE
jgi:hypothetical protein